jgi:hypothetical protein
VRAWLRAHPSPSNEDFALAGFVAPNWPRPWGIEADLVDQLVIREELAVAGLSAPRYPFETEWIGPSLLMAGSRAQQDRYLWPMITGQEAWCRLHSEPDAGSDLAMIGTRATTTDGGFAITGQKIWSGNAANTQLGALLARTSGRPGDREGISYFVLPMDAEGVTLRPIGDLIGRTVLNEVFLDDVLVPSGHLIGREGDGLRIRRPHYPRPVALFNPGVRLGSGPSVYELLMLLDHPELDEEVTGRLLDRYIEAQSLDALTLLDAHEQVAFGNCSELRADVRRLLLQEHGRAVLEWVHDVTESLDGREDVDDLLALLDRPELLGAIWSAPFVTLSAGTSEMHHEAIVCGVFGQPAERRSA